ncbi:uncharacterized protein LOC117642105 isoform X2 [Thrips palmi]|uniref:Uncharacterized protein LOC117642105 isoform X2 n=1 Tax=Thrips palmi TaxID=161013 RepID=A0A6P8YP26_THRPL|nr:uncharacterized protein LOC117642105 isoform X2 [Thrips palmi]
MEVADSGGGDALLEGVDPPALGDADENVTYASISTDSRVPTQLPITVLSASHSKASSSLAQSPVIPHSKRSSGSKHALRQQAKRRRKNTTIASGLHQAGATLTGVNVRSLQSQHIVQRQPYGSLSQSTPKVQSSDTEKHTGDPEVIDLLNEEEEVVVLPDIGLDLDHEEEDVEEIEEPEDVDEGDEVEESQHILYGEGTPHQSTMREVLASIPGFRMRRNKRGLKKSTKRSTQKLSAAAQLRQTEEGLIDLETPDSILVNTNLRALLNKHTLSMLPPLYQHKLTQLLPSVDRVHSAVGLSKIASSGLNNEFFARGCQEWRDRLAEGEFTSENQQKLRAEAEREKNRLDPWKLKHFEPIWGWRHRPAPQPPPQPPPENSTEHGTRAPIRTTIKLRNTNTVSSTTEKPAPAPAPVDPVQLARRLRSNGAVTRAVSNYRDVVANASTGPVQTASNHAASSVPATSQVSLSPSSAAVTTSSLSSVSPVKATFESTEAKLPGSVTSSPVSLSVSVGSGLSNSPKSNLTETVSMNKAEIHDVIEKDPDEDFGSSFDEAIEADVEMVLESDEMKSEDAPCYLEPESHSQKRSRETEIGENDEEGRKKLCSSNIGQSNTPDLELSPRAAVETWNESAEADDGASLIEMVTVEADVSSVFDETEAEAEESILSEDRTMDDVSSMEMDAVGTPDKESENRGDSPDHSSTPSLEEANFDVSKDRHTENEVLINISSGSTDMSETKSETKSEDKCKDLFSNFDDMFDEDKYNCENVDEDNVRGSESDKHHPCETSASCVDEERDTLFKDDEGESKENKQECDLKDFVKIDYDEYENKVNVVNVSSSSADSREFCVEIVKNNVEEVLSEAEGEIGSDCVTIEELAGASEVDEDDVEDENDEYQATSLSKGHDDYLEPNQVCEEYNLQTEMRGSPDEPLETSTQAKKIEMQDLVGDDEDGDEEGDDDVEEQVAEEDQGHEQDETGEVSDDNDDNEAMDDNSDAESPDCAISLGKAYVDNSDLSSTSAPQIDSDWDGVDSSTEKLLEDLEAQANAVSALDRIGESSVSALSEEEGLQARLGGNTFPPTSSLPVPNLQMFASGSNASASGASHAQANVNHSSRGVDINLSTPGMSSVQYPEVSTEQLKLELEDVVSCTEGTVSSSSAHSSLSNVMASTITQSSAVPIMKTNVAAPLLPPNAGLLVRTAGSNIVSSSAVPAVPYLAVTGNTPLRAIATPSTPSPAISQVAPQFRPKLRSKDAGLSCKTRRNNSSKPPPGAVNLERSYQICQAVIQNSPNRDQLRFQLKPPPSLLANTAGKSSSDIPQEKASSTQTQYGAVTSSRGPRNVSPNVPPTIVPSAGPALIVKQGKTRQPSPPVLLRQVFTSQQGIPVTMAMLPQSPSAPSSEGGENIAPAVGQMAQYILLQRTDQRSLKRGAPPRASSAPPSNHQSVSGVAGLARGRPSSVDADCSQPHQQVYGQQQGPSPGIQAVTRCGPEGYSVPALPDHIPGAYPQVIAQSQELGQAQGQGSGSAHTAQGLQDHPQEAMGEANGQKNDCACNLKAMIMCKQCGAFCHDDCIGPMHLCVMCLIR